MPPPKDFRTAERPELAAAFAAAGDTAAQVILIPPACTARVVEELAPQLPAELGGGPSSVLTHGIRWAAAGIDVSPHKAFRLVIKSDDAQAALALRGNWPSLLRLAGQRPEIRNACPTSQPLPLSDAERRRRPAQLVSEERTESFESALLAIMQPMLETEARLASEEQPQANRPGDAQL